MADLRITERPATRVRWRSFAGPRTAWAWVVGTFFGVGLLRPGPGTWGSVAAVLIWLAGVYGARPGATGLGWGTLVGAGIAVAVGIPAGTIVGRESGRPDPQQVVIDEVAGQWIALVPCSFAGHADWAHALAALALFRVFDITKPPPARQLERLHGGMGVMLDDVAAGVYALLVAALLGRWW